MPDERLAAQLRPLHGGEERIEINGESAEHGGNSPRRWGTVKRPDNGVMGQFDDERDVGCELARALSEADEALYW